MSYTTDINALPTDPSGGGSIEGNVSLVTNEIPQNINMNTNSNANASLDQSTINQIISGLQQASTNGVTNLPSRDIPRSTTPITQDAYVQPNYIPPPPNKYIEDFESDNESKDDMIREYNKNNQRRDSLDNLYNEIQIPLLLAILYFIFQLPIFKITLFKYLPFLFNTDGNINLNGLLFTCFLYGLVYYTISKTIYNVNLVL